MSYKVIVVNGFAGCGKSTFERMCIEENRGAGAMVSTIDYPKYLIANWGWNGIKTPEVRKYLSDLKDLMSNAPWGDVAFDKTCYGIGHTVANHNLCHDDRLYLVFVDAREPENIAKFVEKYNAITVLIRRPMDDYAPSNHADAEVENFNYEVIIHNTGDLEHLRLCAKNFVEMVNHQTNNGH